MKKFFILIALLCTTNTYAQNHVPNHSFEDTIRCPDNLTRFTGYCAEWSSFGGSPDYYNVCATYKVSVPYTSSGYQQPLHGKAFAGLLAYERSGHFEYIGSKIAPLKRGVGYIVSLSVSLADSCDHATDNLGVFFYKDGYATTPLQSTNSFLSMIPQIHYSNFGIVKDTNWVRLKKYFVADSAYDHILIGGYNNMYNTYQMEFLPGKKYPGWSYYYVDSVVVASAFPPASVGETQAIEELTLYPNPNSGKFVLKGNVQENSTLNIDIVNAIGQIVYNQKIITQGILNKEINLDGIAKGLYLLRVADNTGKSSFIKFSIE